jgi:hypothetical protein
LSRFRAILDEAGVAHRPYRVWYGRDRFTSRQSIPDHSLYHLSFHGQEIRLNALDSLAASLGWDVAALGSAMPNLDAEGMRAIRTLTTAPVSLVVLCAEFADCAEGFSALDDIGLIVKRGGNTIVDVPGMPRFVVAIANLSAPIPTAQPGSDLVKRSLYNRLVVGPNGDRVLRDHITVTNLRDLSCRGDPELTTCSFVFELSTGEKGQAQLSFDRLGFIWRLTT